MFHRRSIRLPYYDYSQDGAYFITLISHARDRLFGEIIDGKMLLNEFGKIARNNWVKTPSIRPEVKLGKFIVMPNHLHGIIWISKGVSQYAPTQSSNQSEKGVSQYAPTQSSNQSEKGASQYAPTKRAFRSPSKTLGAIIRGYKSSVTKEINIIRKTSGSPIWQRNYYEHIIRNEIELNNISHYILNNPQNWGKDKLFNL